MRAAIVVLLVCVASYASACASCGGSSGGHSSYGGYNAYSSLSSSSYHAPATTSYSTGYSPRPARPAKKPCNPAKKQLRAAKQKMKSLKASLKSVKAQIIKCYGRGAIPKGGSRRRPRAPRRRYCNRPTFNMDACTLSRMIGGTSAAQAVDPNVDPTDMTRGNRNFQDFICRFKQGKINTVGCPFAKGGCRDCGDNAPGFGAAFKLAKSSAGATAAAAPLNPFLALLNSHGRCGSCQGGQ